jgi:hypothetical protein
MRWSLCLLLLTGCQDIGKRVVKGPEIPLVNDSGEALDEVILPAEQKPFQEEFPANAEHWTPTAAEILKAQLLVHQFIKEKLPSAVPSLKSYRRQYAGYQTADGKVLFVNFFCRSPETWRTVPVQKEGRDGCYFSLKVDLKRNEAFGFSVYEADTHPDSLPIP